MNFSEHKPNKKLWYGLHLVALLSILGYQILSIQIVELSVTVKGAIIFLLQAILYFVNVFWVVPTAFDTKKHLTFAIRIVFLIVVYTFFRALIIFNLTPLLNVIKLLLSQEQQVYSSFQLALVLGTSFLLGFYWQNEKNRLEREDAIIRYVDAINERDRIKTIIYQMQLNPHLIYNTLNAIKNQSEDDQPNVAIAAQLLSNILRHTLVDPLKQEKISLHEIIDDLRALVKLYQYLRKGKLYVMLEEEYDSTVDLFFLPPCLLFTLADNVFKYGHLHEEEYPGLITLSVQNSVLEFKTFNYKKFNTFPGSGIGQKNAGIILNHYFQGKYTLDIEDFNNTYSLNLIITL